MPSPAPPSASPPVPRVSQFELGKAKGVARKQRKERKNRDKKVRGIERRRASRRDGVFPTAGPGTLFAPVPFFRRGRWRGPVFYYAQFVMVREVGVMAHASASLVRSIYAKTTPYSIHQQAVPAPAAGERSVAAPPAAKRHRYIHTRPTARRPGQLSFTYKERCDTYGED